MTTAMIPLSNTEADELATQLKALADPVRLRIIAILDTKEGQISVEELAKSLGLAQPSTSHHLRILRGARLVDVVESGLRSHYYLRRDMLTDAMRVAKLWQSPPTPPPAPTKAPISDSGETYYRQRRRCGRASCRVCRDGEGHGPYWYALRRDEQGVLHSRYVGKTPPRGVSV
jgi:DNA-binding transcriptional ArsR family regulator